MKTIISMIKSDDWKQHYDALNALRVLNKFNRDTLLGERSAYGSEESECSRIIAQFVKEGVDNLRSNLTKCALMLVKEIFGSTGADVYQEPDQRLRSLLRTSLPTVLLKTVFEKQFIAIEAKKACEACVSNKANALPEAVDVFVEGSKQIKNLPLAE